MTSPSKSYLLDTSAILAFYHGESGSQAVRRLFEARKRGEAAIYISFMTIFELTYILKSRDSHLDAESLITEVRSLEMDEVWLDEDLMRTAADIKACGGLSVADAFIAACAVAEDAVLVHRDSEFSRAIPGLVSISVESIPVQ